MKRIKRASEPRRWRRQTQVHPVRRDCCPDCGKQSFACVADAESHGEWMTKVYGTPYSVYKDHGKIHLTSQEVSYG